jgi:outer membrane protein insertion porin family
MAATRRRRRPVRWAGVLLPLFFAFAPSAAAEAGADVPPVVSAVTFQVASPYRISYEELAGLVAVRAGEPLSGRDLRESIRRLYSKALFKQVSVYLRDEDGSAEVKFFLFPAPTVSDVEVYGAKRVPAPQILAASRIRRGAILEGSDLPAAEEAVSALLRDKGFLDPSVAVSAACSLETGSGRVRIDVREGPPGVVRSISLDGAEYFSQERLEALLGVEPGAPYDFRRAEEGIRRLRVAYKEAGFLTVQVAEPDVPCEDGDGVCLASRVEEGPRYAVAWKGARAFSQRRLEKVSGIHGPDEESSEAGLAFDLRERLLAFYRERDHIRAKVEVEVADAEDGGRLLTITLDEGEAGYLKRIRFEGNESLSGRQLKKQMLSVERGFFHFITGSGDFDEEVWNADLAALIGLYQKEGFARARIASVDTDWDARGGITATIRVDEGARYTLRTIRFRGADHFLREELLARIGNREGRHIDYVGFERDRDSVMEHYRNSGYLDAEVEAALEFDEEEDVVDARFDVREGARYHRGAVAVRGNHLTESVAVLREVTVPEGAPAGEQDLLRFQQAVFGTGLYKSVRLHRVKRPAEGIVDLIVEVDEALFLEFEFGAGYGTDTGLRGFVGGRHRNLNGLGRRVSLNVAASQKELSYVADLREPWILGNRWKWEGGLTGSYQEADRESFSLRKTSAVASINRTVFLRSSVSLQYELSRDDVFDVTPGAILSPEDQGTATISALRGLFVLDFRDDPFNPTRGSLYSGSAELASAYLGSEVDYYKLAGQSSWYVPVFRRNVLAVSGRAGVVRPLGDTVEVPIQKRFFLGGRTTVRGFKEESVGPQGADGAPTGGDYMVNANVEIRSPLKYGFIGAVFLDAGSVWLGGSPVDGFDLRESAGVGLRYITPVGPISFDYGWKLDRRDGESPSEWHFTIGAVF